jgi:hypothetical protein
MTKTMTGGCQCGRIRYTAQVSNNDAYLCHCRMCQRATGGVSIAFKGFKAIDVMWAHEPDWYQSSPIARRPFCATCGTPLGFQYLDSDKLDLTVGSFDDPSGFVPIVHFGAESLHEAWIDTSALRRDRADEYPSLIERWKNADA